MALGQEAAQLISQKFPPPVKLEFEKVRGCCSADCNALILRLPLSAALL